jgi:uncharacterized membrane protein (UPF0127 family)
MTRVIIIVLILAAVIIIDSIFFARKFVTIDKRWKDYKVVKYSLKNKQYKFLVADTSEKWVKGLMDVRKLDNLDGMIFMFPSAEPKSFWNENTYVDLDIYWIKKGKVVGQSFLPSIEKSKSRVIISSPEPVDTVIEFVKK